MSCALKNTSGVRCGDQLNSPPTADIKEDGFLFKICRNDSKKNRAARMNYPSRPEAQSPIYAAAGCRVT